MAAKSVADKLQIKAGKVVLTVNDPADYAVLLGKLPDGARMMTKSEQPVDIVHVFAHNCAEMEKLLPGLKDRLKPGGFIWLSYHKGGSGVATDINRDSIWRYRQTIGLQAVSQVAINDDWSALR
jgi:hypothetical protein